MPVRIPPVYNSLDEASESTLWERYIVIAMIHTGEKSRDVQNLSMRIAACTGISRLRV